MINNQNVDNAKGISYPMNKGDRIAIQFSTDGNSISTVTLQLGGEGGWMAILNHILIRGIIPQVIIHLEMIILEARLVAVV